MIFTSNLRDLRERGNKVLNCYRNLNNFEKMIVLVRLISSISIIVFGVILTGFSSAFPTKIYMGKLKTSSADILAGLYNTLTASFLDSKSTSVNNGVGLTTSEILLLTEYVESQVQDIPNYFTTNLYGWCEVTLYSSGSISQTNTSDTLQTICTVLGSGYVFDYQDILGNLGLGIILSYAYGYESEDGVLDSENSSGESYNKYLSSTKSTKSKMMIFLYFVICLEFVTFLMGLFFYYIRGRPFHLGKERMLRHSISLFKLVTLVFSCIIVIQLARYVFTLSDKIDDELGSYGFEFFVGKSWFACLILFGFFNFVSTLFWTGLEWCIIKSDVDEDETFDHSMIGVDMMTVRTLSSLGTDFRSDSLLIPPTILVGDNTNQ